MSNEFTERESRVRESFSRQGFMQHLGAEITALGPGECEIRVPYRKEMTQQHGYFHAGVAAAIADSACGYAAYGLMPVTSSVLTVEYKINLVAPAAGETLIARARVAIRKNFEDLRGGCFCCERRQRDTLRNHAIDDHGDAGSLGYGGEILMLAGWRTFTGQAEGCPGHGQELYV